MRIYARRPPIERFYEKVNKTDRCWEWTGAVGRGGYGNFWDGKTYRNAHVFMWIYCNGPITDGMHVCHRCDNRKCVNPEHLFLGTRSDNMSDCSAKGRLNHYSGTEAPSSKLNCEKVKSIRALHALGWTKAELSRMWSMSFTTIRCVVDGVTWRHVT